MSDNSTVLLVTGHWSPCFKSMTAWCQSWNWRAAVARTLEDNVRSHFPGISIYWPQVSNHLVLDRCLAHSGGVPETDVEAWPALPPRLEQLPIACISERNDTYPSHSFWLSRLQVIAMYNKKTCICHRVSFNCGWKDLIASGSWETRWNSIHRHPLNVCT
jgi:hypothetical protein